MAQSYLLNNVPVTAVGNSPNYTVPANVTTFSFDLVVAAPNLPNNTDGSRQFFIGQIQYSKDNGSSWSAVEQIHVAGGLNYLGQPIVSHASGELVNLNQGDLIRAAALQVPDGSTWELTASITAT